MKIKLLLGALVLGVSISGFAVVPSINVWIDNETYDTLHLTRFIYSKNEVQLNNRPATYLLPIGTNENATTAAFVWINPNQTNSTGMAIRYDNAQNSCMIIVSASTIRGITLAKAVSQGNVECLVQKENKNTAKIIINPQVQQPHNQQ